LASEEKYEPPEVQSADERSQQLERLVAESD
jgi:hypothetical protein